MLGDDVDYAFVAFETASDEHRRCFSGNFAEASPAAFRHNDVDQPGFVFEVEERDTLRCHRPLTMGDDTGDSDNRAGLRVPELV